MLCSSTSSSRPPTMRPPQRSETPVVLAAPPRPESGRKRSTLAGTSRPAESMPPIVVLVAAGAAIGIGLVVYGLVSQDRAQTVAATTGTSTRVTYRTLADVREQLRR